MTLLLKETLEQRILRIADQLQPEIQRTFIAAVEAARRSIPIGELSDFFDEGNIQGALEAAGVNLTPAELEPITDAILQTTLNTAELAAIDLNLEFALVNERAVRFAREEAARLVTSVSSETEKAIRDIVVRGQREGLNARLQAQEIRRVVGLTDRDARAVDRFYSGLLGDGTRQARAGELADRMSARLLRRRAENIARTETIRAANMGNQLAWQTAMDGGLLPRSSQKIWIATADSRTCPICAVLHDQTVSVSSTFDISERATTFTRTGGGENLRFRPAKKVPLTNPSAELSPPAHPSCRCTMGTVFGGADQRLDAPSPPESKSVFDAADQLLASTPKKHQARMREALGKIDGVLKGAPPAVRRRYISIMERTEAFKVTTTSKRTMRLKRGRFESSRFGTTKGKWPRLQSETRTYNEDWVRWELKRETERKHLAPGVRQLWDETNPEPKFFRFATSTEQANTLVHELTHGLNYFDDLDRSLSGTPLKNRLGRWRDGGFHSQFKEIAEDFSEFSYGSGSAAEGIAEASRMYLFGLKGRTGLRGTIGQMTAAEWRSTFPSLAKAVEDIVWDIT